MNPLFLIALIGIVYGLALQRPYLLLFLTLELMFLAINLNFIIASIIQDDLVGQIFALFILTVTAADSAIGLAILVVYHRSRTREVQ